MMEEGLPSMIMEWMNGYIRIDDDGTAVIHLSEMLQYFAVILCSHTTGQTMAEKIDLRKRHSAVVPSKRMVLSFL